MKLGYITIMVSDLARSLAFYQDVTGLQVVRQFSPGKGDIAFLVNQEGETMLELAAFPGVPPVQVSGMILSFTADKPLEELRSAAEAKGYAPAPIRNEGPKPPHFIVHDPDGMAVEIGV